MRVVDRVRVVLTPEPVSGVNAVDLTGSDASLPSCAEKGSIPSSRSKDRHKPGYMAAYMRMHRAK